MCCETFKHHNWYLAYYHQSFQFTVLRCRAGAVVGVDCSRSATIPMDKERAVMVLCTLKLMGLVGPNNFSKDYEVRELGNV